jgi:hypothetical protein
MNARSSIRELDRIRSAVGSALRTEYAAVEPAPESLIALLNDLANRVRDAEREKIFAEVEVRVMELLRAAGRQPWDVRTADETVPSWPPGTEVRYDENSRSIEKDPMHLQIVMDTSGDTCHRFDPADASAVAEAEKRLRELVEEGFVAAKRTGDGTSELVRHFDPADQETLFIPRLVGGWRISTTSFSHPPLWRWLWWRRSCTNIGGRGHELVPRSEGSASAVLAHAGAREA